MRQLASIKRITDIQPIEGKDRIVLAMVDGWSVIVQKSEFQVGDLCVYVEIDSVLPEKPEFEFLRSKNFRIKTMKMAGVISQGICFPLSILPAGRSYQEGEDVTELIGVTQYEPTMDKERDDDNTPKKKYPRWVMRNKLLRRLILGKKKGGSKAFPSFVHKTDETRIQNMPFILKDKQPYVATEKIDGQSGTFALVRHKHFLRRDTFEYIVCSRNYRLPKPDNSSYWSVSNYYNIEDILKDWIGKDDWIAIQGECVGPGIQKNKYHLDRYDLYVFNVITPNGRLGSVQAKKLCGMDGLNFVPILQTDYVLPDTVNEVLEYAHGKSALYDTLREGIVFRSQDGKHSFKAVDPLFLLKYDE